MSVITLRTSEDSPAHPRHWEWLSWREREVAACLPSAQRREEWLRGRWLAKLLVETITHSTALSQIHIETIDAAGKSTEPTIYVNGAVQPLRLSISHSGRRAMAAAAGERAWRVGCDLVEVGEDPPGFVRFWFTPSEQEWVRRSGCSSAARVLWGLKESFYKALGSRQPFQPRRWDVLSLLSAAGLRLPAQAQTLPQHAQRSPRGAYSIRSVGDHLAIAVAVKSGPLSAFAQTATGPFTATI